MYRAENGCLLGFLQGYLGAGIAGFRFRELLGPCHYDIRRSIGPDVPMGLNSTYFTAEEFKKASCSMSSQSRSHPRKPQTSQKYLGAFLWSCHPPIVWLHSADLDPYASPGVSECELRNFPEPKESKSPRQRTTESPNNTGA